MKEADIYSYLFSPSCLRIHLILQQIPSSPVDTGKNCVGESGAPHDRLCLGEPQILQDFPLHSSFLLGILWACSVRWQLPSAPTGNPSRQETVHCVNYVTFHSPPSPSTTAGMSQRNIKWELKELDSLKGNGWLCIFMQTKEDKITFMKM